MAILPENLRQIDYSNPTEAIMLLEGYIRYMRERLDFAMDASSSSSGSDTSIEGDKHFVYSQVTPSDTWVVTHNLGKEPAIEVVDSAGTVVIGQYTYNDLNTVTLTFTGAFAGKAYFN